MIGGEEVEKVRDRGPQPLDLEAVDRADMAQHLGFVVAAGAKVEEATKGALVLRLS